VPLIPLEGPVWRARQAAHAQRVDAFVAAHRGRRARGTKHPVEDFLFTYYSFRPAQLRRWQPGAGYLLRDARPEEFGPDFRYVDGDSGGSASGGSGSGGSGGVTVDVAAVRERRGGALDWILSLLRGTAARPANLGCFGMHEWAMVYRATPEQIRHAAWPLRLSPAGTDAVVEANRVRCSHFDAFRFFTEPARRLNLVQPTRQDQADLDQPGCLHANMDLYKFAYKLAPLVGSELIADCFEYAREIRALDMRASPYDLSELGYPPVAVETPEGRAEYVRFQRDFAERGAALRARLIDACDRVVGAASGR